MRPPRMGGPQARTGRLRLGWGHAQRASHTTTPGTTPGTTHARYHENRCRVGRLVRSATGTAVGSALGAIAIGGVAVLVAGLLIPAGRSADAASAAGSGFWHTSGNQILDSGGNQVRIAGINWYGFETPDMVAHGLWAQDYHAIIDDIKNLGYNTIRIPFSNQMVEQNPVPQNLSFYNTGPINTDLKGLTSLQILDKIVTYAGQDGLKVILDDHRSEAGESAEQNGLWYTSTYTNQNWINDWVALAKRYAGNPTVVGFDLHNEPHTPAGDTYAQGATWGSGDPNTDIRLAYEAAGNAIIAADPGALTNLWNATDTQSGEQVTVTNASYNATIAAKGSVTVGFTGSFTSSNAAPASFTVNGTACT